MRDNKFMCLKYGPATPKLCVTGSRSLCVSFYYNKM